MARAAVKNSEPISIYDELVDAARAGDANFTTKGPNEADKDYIIRLMGVVNDLPEKLFNSLSSAAQTWFNESTELANREQDVPPPDGYGDDAPAGDESPKPAAAKPAKAAAAPKPPKEPVQRGTGLVATIRKTLVMDPSLNLEDLGKAMIAAGFSDVKPSTLSSLRSDTLAVINLAKEHQRWAA